MTKRYTVGRARTTAATRNSGVGRYQFKKIGSSFYGVTVKDFPAVARVIGTVKRESDGWKVTPAEEGRAPWGGYPKRAEAADALYDDWFSLGRHTNDNKRKLMNEELTHQMAGALQSIASRGEMTVGRSNDFIMDTISASTTTGLERRGLVERRWTGARDDAVYVTDKGRALADKLLHQDERARPCHTSDSPWRDDPNRGAGTYDCGHHVQDQADCEICEQPWPCLSVDGCGAPPIRR